MGNDQLLIFNLWIYYTIMVVGFYFVFGVSGQFAFSQAAFAMVGGYTSAWATREGIDWILAVALRDLRRLRDRVGVRVDGSEGQPLLPRHRHAGAE